MMGRHGGWLRGGIMLVSFLLLALSTYRLVDDYRTYRAAKELKEVRLMDLARIESERDDARATLEALRSDALTREQLLRSDGYAKPGEEVYVIVPDGSSRPAVPKAAP